MRRYTACVWAWVPAAAGGVAGRDVHTVHVPLEEGDLVVAQQPIEPVMDRGERVVAGQVEHELVPSEHRFVPGRLQDPVGVGAVEVAVGADHLGLDPQAELHAEPTDVRDQGRESVRVDVRRHPPVAERRCVVAAAGEPPVVEHEPLGPDLGSSVGEFPQAAGIVIEVHRLPGVDQHGAGPSAVRRSRADVAVVRPAGVGEPRRGVGAEHRWRRVRRARVEDDLAWPEQFPGRGDASAIGEPFEAQVGIAAPREMDAPDVAVLFAEAVFTRPDERRVLVRRAPCPVLHVDRTAQERLAVRVQLAAPAPVERDDVDGVGGKGDRELEVAERVRRVADVGDGGSHAQQPAGVELDVGFEFQPGDFVPSDDRDVARVGRR